MQEVEEEEVGKVEVVALVAFLRDLSPGGGGVALGSPLRDGVIKSKSLSSVSGK